MFGKAKASKSASRSMKESDNFIDVYGPLRAYANRVTIVAIVEALAILGLAFNDIMIRRIPPTVIQLDAKGHPTVISSPQGGGSESGQGKGTTGEPDDIAKKSFIRTFIGSYMNYNEFTFIQNSQTALAMMEEKLAENTSAKLKEDKTAEEIRRSHEISTVTITSLKPMDNDPQTWEVVAKRTARSVDGKISSSRSLTEIYRVGIIYTERTEQNPWSLLVSKFLIYSSVDNGTAQATSLDN